MGSCRNAEGRTRQKQGEGHLSSRGRCTGRKGVCSPPAPSQCPWATSLPPARLRGDTGAGGTCGWDLVLIRSSTSHGHVHTEETAGTHPAALPLLARGVGRTLPRSTSWGPCGEAFCTYLRWVLGRILPNIYLEPFTFAFHTPPYAQMDVFPISLTSAKAGRTKTAGNIILNVRDLKYNLFRARSDSDHS